MAKNRIKVKAHKRKGVSIKAHTKKAATKKAKLRNRIGGISAINSRINTRGEFEQKYKLKARTKNYKGGLPKTD